MTTIQIIWLILLLIVLSSFIIPIIYWFKNHTTFYSWNEMLEHKNNTPLCITLMLRFNLVFIILFITLIIILTLEYIL